MSHLRDVVFAPVTALSSKHGFGVVTATFHDVCAVRKATDRHGARLCDVPFFVRYCMLVFCCALTWICVFLRNRHGVTYIEDFFSDKDFNLIKSETEKLSNLLSRERSTCAHNRLGCHVPGDSPVNSVLRSVHLGDGIFPSDVPTEYRVYGVGSSMDWHSDTPLYREPQYEMVYTIENTTDSYTEWSDGLMSHRIYTKPNSLLIVRANGARHRVSPVSWGERKILKFVHTTTLEKTPEYEENLKNYNLLQE